MRLKDVTINATSHKLPPLSVHFGVSYGHCKNVIILKIFILLIKGVQKYSFLLNHAQFILFLKAYTFI